MYCIRVISPTACFTHKPPISLYQPTWSLASHHCSSCERTPNCKKWYSVILGRTFSRYFNTFLFTVLFQLSNSLPRPLSFHYTPQPVCRCTGLQNASRIDFFSFIMSLFMKYPVGNKCMAKSHKMFLPEAIYQLFTCPASYYMLSQRFLF